MSLDPAALPASAETFLSERHLATLTTTRPDGTAHVTPVGFTWDSERRLIRIISFAAAKKVRNLRSGPTRRVAVCQVEGGRWMTFEGDALVTSDPVRVAEAVRRYAERYRPPGERPDRVAIEVSVERILGRA